MHEQFLLAALEQAKQGRGLCAPNPSVGAVAVQNEKIIAQAWHKGAGTPHAEPLLLAQIPPNTPGVNVYITLEPCAMCAGALGWSQISDLIYGASDEKKGYTNISGALLHPKTKVLSGVMEKECRDVLLKFFKGKR